MTITLNCRNGRKAEVTASKPKGCKVLVVHKGATVDGEKWSPKYHGWNVSAPTCGLKVNLYSLRTKKEAVALAESLEEVAPTKWVLCDKSGKTNHFTTEEVARIREIEKASRYGS